MEPVVYQRCRLHIDKCMETLRHLIKEVDAYLIACAQQDRPAEASRADDRIQRLESLKRGLALLRDELENDQHQYEQARWRRKA